MADSCNFTTDSTFTLLYSSQNGTAQHIAEEIAHAAPKYGLKPALFSTGLMGTDFSMKNITCLVLVASTTGDGDPPDSAVRFYRSISHRYMPDDNLSKISYALLALGDSTYGSEKFCEFGRAVDTQFLVHGAHKFYDTAYADDVGKFNEVIFPWIGNLWPLLRKQLGLPKLPFSELVTTFSVSDEKIASFDPSKFKQCVLPPIHSCGVPLMKTISIKEMHSFVKTVKQTSLNLTTLPEPYLTISFTDNTFSASTPDSGFLNRFSSANSAIVQTKIIAARRMTTKTKYVKKTLELTLKFEENKIHYEPGDTFGFICCNSPGEVSYLLKRLGKSDVADKLCKISVQESHTNEMSIPFHIPPMSTLRHILSWYIDLRSVVNQRFLRVLANYATDDLDRMSLELLSSQEGLVIFKACVLNSSIGILDILKVFKSCSPPIECLLEYLPYLRPRFYSIASSPLISEDTFRIVFNVIKMQKDDCQIIKQIGICSGMLNRNTINLQNQMNSATRNGSGVSHLCLKENHNDKPIPSVLVFKKFNKHFYLPEDKRIPIIMVGTGTGISPFMSFLQHREQQIVAYPENTFGEMWLFYGCRYKNQDFLYRHELERLQSTKVLTHLIVCFSREKTYSYDEDISQARYVQDNIVENSVPLMGVLDKGGIIYVCGSAKKNMQDIWEAFVKVIETTKYCKKQQAETYLKMLRNKRRYRIDAWC